MSQLNEYNREIRVFLSSTFKDMDEERRYLVEQVFPLVRLACAQRQVVFTEIDLRWGITELEAKNGRTVEICLEEIDRSRNSPPFFIGFLGERYGWIPTHDDLKKYLDGHDSPYADKIAQALEQGISVTELEMQHAFLNQQVDKAHARIFLRSRVLTEQLYDAQLGNVKPGDFYDAADGKLDTLKAKLRSLEHGVMGLDGYQTVAEFGEAVKNFLMDSLERLYPDEPRSALQTYLDSQAIYAQSRLFGYVPLVGFTQKVIEALKRTKADNQMRHVHLYGESGLGKSAFLAYLQTQLPIQMGAQVLAHFVGAETSATPEGWRDQLMARLRHQLAQIQTVDKQNEFEQALNIAGEEKDTWDAFYDLLAKYQQAIKQPVILLLDAINQMHGVSRLFEKFNPINLPHDVFLVTSAIEEYPLQLTQNTPLPKLDSDLIRNITHGYLADYQKTLPPEVVTLLANAEACKNSLFLKMLLEELRLLGRHETLLEQAQAMIGLKTPAKLFEQTLQDIDTYAAQNGVAVQPAKKIMQFIQLSYRGLTQHQLKQLLSQSTGFTLHDAHLSPVLARLRNFLLLEEGRFRVMHTAFALPILQNQVEQHRLIIVQYSDQSTMVGLLEILYQYIQINEENEVTGLLGSYFFELFEADERLFRDALSLIGAGEDKVNSNIETLMNAVQTKLEQTLPDALKGLGIFLLDNSFLNIAELILKKYLEYAQQSLPDGHLDIALSLNNLALLNQEQYRLAEAETLFQQALEIKQKSLPSEHPYIATSLNNLAMLYFQQGRLAEAEPLLTHIFAIMQKCLPSVHPNIARSYNNLALIYYAQNRLSDVEPLYRKALAIYQKSLPADHLDTASCLINLAEFYREQNRLAEAEALFQEALGIYQKSLPEGHPKIASSLNYLAILYYAQNRPIDAEILCQKALVIYQKARPEGHPDIAKGLNNLASLYRAKNHLAEAEALFQEALEINQKARPVGHPEVATSLCNLAEIYLTQSRLVEAEPLFQEALAIRQQSLPSGHPNIANSLNNLAGLYCEQGRLDEADRLYQEALAIRQQSLPSGHPNIANSLNNLAGLYREQGRLVEAERLFQEALAICQQSLPSGHPGIANSLNNLAGLYREQGRLDEAEPLFKEALAIRQKSLPIVHSDIASSLNNLAELYLTQGRLVEAEPLFQQALGMRQQFLPAGQLDIANSLNNLAGLYREQGRLDEAEPLFKEALAIRQKSLPVVHPDIASSLNNLAELYLTQGRLVEAEPLFKEALLIHQKKLPSGHPDIANSLNFLAETYRAQNRFVEAESLFQEALAIYSKTLPVGHPHIGISMYNLAGLYEAQNRLIEAESHYQQALAILQKALPSGHSYILNVINNLAFVYIVQGKFEQADKAYIGLLIQKVSMNVSEEQVTQLLGSIFEMYQKAGYDDAEKRVMNIWKSVIQELNIN